MAHEISIAAETRTVTGRHVHALRREGRVPAVLYGHNITPENLSTDAHELDRVWLRAGRTHLINLVVDGRSRKVVIKALQRNPRNNSAIHVDLYVVNLKEKMVSEVPVVLVGESPAVVDSKIGQLQHTLTHLRVSSLPGDLPASLSVDVTGLVAIDDSITVAQIELPKGVELVHGDTDEVVVKVAALRVQEAEPEPTAEAPAAAEPAAGGDEG